MRGRTTATVRVHSFSYLNCGQSHQEAACVCTGCSKEFTVFIRSENVGILVKWIWSASWFDKTKQRRRDVPSKRTANFDTARQSKYPDTFAFLKYFTEVNVKISILKEFLNVTEYNREKRISYMLILNSTIGKYSFARCNVMLWHTRNSHRCLDIVRCV